MAGKVIIESDMTTLYQETCPMDTADVVAAARAVQNAGLRDDLSVTVDPARDAPTRLAACRSLFPDPPANWLTVTGVSRDAGGLWKLHLSGARRT